MLHETTTVPVSPLPDNTASAPQINTASAPPHPRVNTVPTPNTPLAPSLQVDTAQVDLGQMEDTPTVFEMLVMRTALADVCTDRKSTTAKIFVDEGAQVSLISQRLAHSLGAGLTPFQLDIVGLGSGNLPSRFMTNVELSSANDLESPSVMVSCPRLQLVIILLLEKYSSTIKKFYWIKFTNTFYRMLYFFFPLELPRKFHRQRNHQGSVVLSLQLLSHNTLVLPTPIQWKCYS